MAEVARPMPSRMCAYPAETPSVLVENVRATCVFAQCAALALQSAGNMSTSPPRTDTSAPARVAIRPGEPFPLGATWDGRGTNFAVFSEVADAVDLCLFDDDGHETRIRLPERTAFCWHGYLSGIGPGQRYGFRVH